MDYRQTALEAAVYMHVTIPGDLHIPTGPGRQHRITDAETDILATADRFYGWLRGTVSLRLVEGPVLDQSTGQPTGTTRTGDTAMQLHDNEKFDLVAATEDAKGFATGDAITWAADDNGAVLTLAVSADGKTCTVAAVAPGHAVITVTDSAVTPALTATESVDVVPGGTAKIALAEGPVAVQ